MALDHLVPWDALFLREQLGTAPSTKVQKVYVFAPRISIELTLAVYGDRISVDKLAKLMKDDSASNVESLAEHLKEEYEVWSARNPEASPRIFLEEFLDQEHELDKIRVQLACQLIELTIKNFGDKTTLDGTIRSLERSAIELRKEAVHLQSEFGEWLRRKINKAGIQPDGEPPPEPSS